ncbi:MAG: alternative ribosome rescue aminoacyl-tRNA hydrolase ArfB [Gammaproteobacteria bacterium]|nr:alternative ribosome rescue aminoacyl-tRNA hydrolase ArfB [Gammaproteobacteria bacterium]MDH5731443.1 alternative ribosome rescue aminoacyl-tRNA hydrolase ArfB [Gammaproteobacteria bacterium]
MLNINRNLSIPLEQIQINAIHSQGAGGQNVNKLATAIHLRFDVNASDLPEPVKQKILAYQDQRINKEGVIIIKAQRFRSQEKNKQDALNRLAEFLQTILKEQALRKPTKPSRAAKKRRLDEKQKLGQKKLQRQKKWQD